MPTQTEKELHAKLAALTEENARLRLEVAEFKERKAISSDCEDYSLCGCSTAHDLHCMYCCRDVQDHRPEDLERGVEPDREHRQGDAARVLAVAERLRTTRRETSG